MTPDIGVVWIGFLVRETRSPIANHGFAVVAAIGPSTTGNEYLWVNPSPETEPDIANADAGLRMTAEFQAAGFPFLRLRVGYTRAIFQFDELRVATTFAEIANPF